jgi:3-hydroxyacyl-CoA dehydrogenase
MTREIKSVAVLGAGTMGTGIAGLAAEKNCKVLLLDTSMEAAEKALDRIINGRPPAIDTPGKEANITLGTLADDLKKIANYDWICEAVIEDLDTKRTLFERFEPLRKDGSVVSTNTSGIPLSDITEGMPDRLLKDIAVTHFFNPVKIMKLCELVPGEKTDAEVINIFHAYLGGEMGKGVVNAKDTVNFIGNRIGCFWMLRGLHAATDARGNGLSQERIDALMSAPVGLPPTGLYGLIDLIGLDIMDFVGKNLEINLPEGDMGADYTKFPAAEHAMLERGQLGRKTGGGFYRVSKLDDGSKKKEAFDLNTGDWRDAEKVTLDVTAGVMFEDSADGQFSWDIMGSTLAYAANLIPAISDDIVNVDRAMRWGFAWGKGPFELLDALGPLKFLEKCRANGHAPKMLEVLEAAGAETFYKDGEFLGLDGKYHTMPAE